ncbi:MAG: S8 family serine peptidase [Bacteroidaceae bacterium]|nr:S8 family serine peptidase [Bacteroidaceae bacterium]
MKHYHLFLSAALLMCEALPTVAQSNNNQDEVVKIERHTRRAYREGEVLVKFKAGSSIVQSGARSVNAGGVSSVLSSLGVSEMEPLMPLIGETQKQTGARALSGKPVNDMDLTTLYRVHFDAAKIPSVHTAIEKMKGLDEVEFAEPNYLVYALSDEGTAVTDYDTYCREPLYNQQWGHHPLKMPFLWQQPKLSDKRPVIAILDTGVDITHPDLVDNIWTNTLEAEGEEEADDDNNGFADDLHGWDFVNQTGRIGDWNGHGTHCAGIAAAVGDNGIGIAGANPDALIMPITVMQSDGTGDVATIIKGIDYAVANGADVLSMSFGGYSYSLAEEQALAKAYQKAVLVAAAGNDCTPINPNVQCDVCKKWGAPMFPAAFTFVLGVEASPNGGGRSVFSNYDDDGPTFSTFGEDKLYNYELRAPGSAIMSTYPGGKYKALNGTSMACPFVAGGVSRLLQTKEYSSWEVLFGDLIHTRKQNGYGDVDFEAAYRLTDADRIPELGLVTYLLKDTIVGDADGRPDAGETIALYPTLRNEWGQATNVTFSLEVAENEDPTIVEILDESVAFGKSLSSYGKNISANPVRFKVNDDCADGRKIRLVLKATCDNIAEELAHEFTIEVENGVEIGGLVTEDMTLYPGVNYIVTSTILVRDTAVLTILPGTTLAFKGKASIGTYGGGKVICKGEPGNSIFITSANAEARIEEFSFGNDTVEYVVFENLFPDYCLFSGSSYFENCVFRNIKGFGSVDRLFLAGGNIVYSNIYDLYNFDPHIENNCFCNNIVNAYKVAGVSENINNCNVFNNTNERDQIQNVNYYSQYYSVCDAMPNYFGSSKEETVRMSIYDAYHPIEPTGTGVYEFSNMLTCPSAETHAIVWKVVVNGYDAQDEFDLLPPLGVGKHKFEVYFNRPMDTSFTPTIAMGVRPPYTQHMIAEEGSWNEDRTIYTAYLTITGKMNADGINRIYVADAVESLEDYYLRKELLQLSQKGNSLLQNVANVSGKVLFQTSDASKEGYLSSSMSTSLGYLFNGSYNNFVNFPDNGYLQVDLGEYKEARLISFNYDIYGSYSPNEIIVQGSNDGITFNNVNILSSFDEINPLPGSYSGSFSSFPIDAGTSYRYYRFVFSAKNNRESLISEFGMEVLDPKIKDDYKTLTSDDEIIEIQKEKVSADVLSKSMSRDCTLLQETLDNMYAGYNKLATILGEPLIEQVPVEVSSAPEWVIPVENMRFNVQVAAAGSMSTGLMAEAGLGKVSLTWETDEEDFEDLLGYNIMRYTEVEDSARVKDYSKYGDYAYHWEYFTRMDTVIINPTVIASEETAYTDYDVVPGTTYYYVIKQLTTSLSSHDLSNAVAATPLTAQKGDANGSMAVDVADVVTEIAYMTNQDPQPFIFEAADVNSDLAVNILDVVGTLNIILTPAETGIASVNNTATYTVEDGILYVESPVALGGVQVRIAAPKGTEFTALEGLNGFEQTGNWQSEDEYLFLAYSMVGRTIAPGKQALFRIGEDVVISQVVLSDARGKNVLAINGDATGVGVVEGMQMTLPYPNPFSTELHIPYIIGKEGNHQVAIVISDLAGRTVYNYRTECDYGEHSHTWHPAGNLANGLYLVSLYVDGTLMHTAKALKN